MLERENINYFINAVGAYGVASKDLFQVSSWVYLKNPNTLSFSAVQAA